MGACPGNFRREGSRAFFAVPGLFERFVQRFWSIPAHFEGCPQRFGGYPQLILGVHAACFKDTSSSLGECQHHARRLPAAYLGGAGNAYASYPQLLWRVLPACFKDTAIYLEAGMSPRDPRWEEGHPQRVWRVPAKLPDGVEKCKIFAYSRAFLQFSPFILVTRTGFGTLFEAPVAGLEGTCTCSWSVGHPQRVLWVPAEGLVAT